MGGDGCDIYPGHHLVLQVVNLLLGCDHLRLQSVVEGIPLADLAQKITEKQMVMIDFAWGVSVDSKKTNPTKAEPIVCRRHDVRDGFKRCYWCDPAIFARGKGKY